MNSSSPQTHSSLSAKPSTPASNVSIFIKFTIALIGMIAFLQVYSVQSILPALMIDFAANEVQVGMVVGATVLAIAIMSPLLGMLSDAIGRKNIIVCSIFFLALPTGLIGLSQSIEMLTIWRFLQGLSVPGITVVTLAYIGEEFKGKGLTDLMAYYVSGTVLGGFSGRFLLGHLHEWFGWRTAYFILAAITVAGALWVMKTLPASHHFKPSAKLASAFNTLLGHLTNRYVISACLLGSCVLFTLVGSFTFINLHLADKPYYLNTGQLANIFAVYLIGVIVTPLSSQLIQRFGSARIVVVAVMFSMLGISLTLAAPLWLIVLGLTMMSSGVFITQSATIGYIGTNVSQGRSLASGLYYMCYYAGGTIGAWACAIAYTYGQWSYTVWLVLSLQIMAIIVASVTMIKTHY